ncbi:MAG: class II fructose-bisphosphate aldolase, partial [Candidatus Brocadiia bacterium]
MALASAVPAVVSACDEGRAVPLFVCVDMVATQAVVEAAEETGRPAIVGLYGGLLERPRSDHFVRWARAVAEESAAPLSLMLDHGRSVEACRRALSLGFTDIMYDGSKLAVEENLENTRRVAEAAQAAGAGVEAELGIVGAGSKYSTFGAKGKGFTDPETAGRFAADSGCDILAVAV